MIDNKPETTEQPNPEIIHLRQKFQLFKPKRTHPNMFSHDNFESSVQLETAWLPPLIIRADVQNSVVAIPKGLILTPFEEKGYEFTQEDLDSETRTKKQISLFGEVLNSLIFYNTKAPLLTIAMSRHEQQADLFIMDKPTFLLRPELIKIFERLRLTLFFPKSSYTGIGRANGSSEIGINSFFPSNTEPLPWGIHRFENEGLADGNPISVPLDLKKLSQIKATFIFAPEKPTEGVN